MLSAIILVLGLSSCVFGQLDADSDLLTAEVGSTVTIPSDQFLAEGESFYMANWKYGDEVVVALLGDQYVTPKEDYQERTLLGKSDYNLMMKDLRLSDSGAYRFEILTSLGSRTTDRSLKVVASPVVNARALSVVDTGAGVEEVLAKCFAIGGSPPFTMKWKEDDLVLSEGVTEEENTNDDNDQLVDVTLTYSYVPNAAYDNGRQLTCSVTDAMGRDMETTVSLDVTEPTTTIPTTTMQAFPKIIKFPHSANITMVMEKKRAFNCQATGVPSPKVTWFKDGVELQNGIGESRLQVVADDYYKAGIYKCVASNDEGSDSRELKMFIQGSPAISGVENFPNKTEPVVLKSEDEYVRLVCRSDARPKPDFKWEVEGMNLTELEFSDKIVPSESGIVAYVNISARHFRGISTQTRVTCIATNLHGNDTKDFVVSVPEVVPSNAGMIAGIIVAIIILIAIVILVIYIALAKRQQGSMTTSPESGGPCWSACCGSSSVKSKELKEEEDIVTVEHVKEVSEEGTQEEKQKLTEAEEKPAKEEEKKDEQEETPKEGEEDKPEEEEKEKEKKTKSKIQLPLQCCRGKKEKEPVAEEEAKEEEEKEEGEEKKEETGNGNAKEVADEAKEKRENDRDSGKGDTLEKVIEEEEATNK